MERESRPLENMVANTEEFTPFISVIMNCYNGEKYLKEAIDSIYSQTYQNWEIIFWDNNSEDRSSDIAKSYDDRLRYFKGDKTVPVYSARNLALEQCRGKFVAFLDTDDIWIEDKLERQVSLLSNDRRIIYGGYKDIDGKGNETGRVQNQNPSGKITSRLLKFNPISIGCILVDIDLLKKEKFDDRSSLLGDFDLWVRLSITNEIHSVEGIVELSRQHESNLSDVEKNNWLKERRYFYKKFLTNNSIFQYPQIISYIIKAELKGLINVR